MWEELVALWDTALLPTLRPPVSPVKLAEVCLPSAKKAGMDLELSHSSEHLNLAEREVSSSWDFIAQLISGLCSGPLYKMSGGPVRHIKRGFRRFALLQIDVEKDFVEERSEGVRRMLAAFRQERCHEWSQEGEGEPLRWSGHPDSLLFNLIGSDWSDTDQLVACRKPASRQSQHDAPFYCRWDSVYVSAFIRMIISLRRIKTRASTAGKYLNTTPKFWEL